jgi:tetratricopeptide (TPR) repeat protein
MFFLRDTHQPRQALTALFFLLLCFLSYGNSLHNGFLMDDYPTLLENRQRNTSSFLQVNLRGHETQDYFRPMMHILNSVTYNLFGRDPFGYHIVNLSLFYLACLSLYELLRLNMKDTNVPFLACVLFCIHPINGILVNFKNATGYPLLILATNVSLIHFTQAPQKRNKFLHDALGLAWLTVALLCHELVLAFPLYFAAVLWFLRKERWKEVFLRSLIPLIVLAPYLFFRAHYFSLKTTIIDNIPAFDVSLAGFIGAYLKLIWWYLTKLVFLDGIVLMWSVPVMGNTAIATSLVVAGGVAFGLILRAILKSPRPGKISFALCWMLIGFLPVAVGCFSRPLFGIIIEPHWLFFSSIGYFVFLAALLIELKGRINKKLWRVFIACIVLFHLSHTHRYNHLWADQKRYCRYWQSLAPSAYWPNFWLGYAYLEEKNYAAAREAYARVSEGSIRDAALYTNRGIAEYLLGNREASLKYFKRSLEMDPFNADTLCSLGGIFLQEHDTPKARKAFSMALNLDPTLQTYIKKTVMIYQRQNPADQSESLSGLLDPSQKE